MTRLKTLDGRWIWIGLGVLIILLRILLSFFPRVVETIYSRGIFLGIRTINDFTLSYSPIPLLYVFLFLFLTWLGFKAFSNKKIETTKKLKAINFLFSTFSFVGGMIFFFIFLWGFNYGRIPIEKQLDIYPKTLSDDELTKEFNRASTILFQKFNAFEEWRNNNSYDITGLEKEIREDVKRTLKRFGYPTPGRVRARLLWPKGILMRISTAGVYLPWVNECHIDAGLHPIQMPNVMAHEMAHGYGITDEGSCNFIALQACIDAENVWFQYSAALSYSKTVAGNYRINFPEAYAQFKENMPKSIWQDIQDINKNLDKYPDIFPVVRDFFYNNYLKSQGISEGLKNYSRVILLEAAYERAKQND